MGERRQKPLPVRQSLGGDCMKKIIAISVMFVLLTGAAFAVDLGGSVNATVNVLEGNNGEGSEVTSSAGIDQLRLEGAGENDDGTFGGWIRVEGFYAPAMTGEDFTGHNWETDPIGYLFNGFGYGWWKPIDQLLLRIGQQPDGFWGKEGVTGWMFYQSASDVGVVNPGNVWGGSYGSDADYGVFRNAFYGGFGGRAAMLEITPAEMFQINIAIPFFEGGKTAYVFQYSTVQVDLKLDFGNIAFTYVGGISQKAKLKLVDVDGDGFIDPDDPDETIVVEDAIDNPGAFYAYFGGSFGAIAIDFGVGYHLPGLDKFANPIWVGAGVKYSADTFGVKLRLLAGLAGDDKATRIRTDILPYFILSDNMRAYVSFGLGVYMPKGGDTSLDWHFNPYIEVGQEWGPKFLAGVKAWSAVNGEVVNWAVPIALEVSF